MGGLFHFRRTTLTLALNHPRLGELGGLGMSFNFCRGALGTYSRYSSLFASSSGDGGPSFAAVDQLAIVENAGARCAPLMVWY